ncbi:MAG: DUF4178 domain-containing protein, partial [Deltaproteobacteria bacterium]|nr:DUF4178 domain-containing protein [Deltaproteobacteria bacterium]
LDNESLDNESLDNVSLSKIDCGECGAPVDIAESIGRGQVVCSSCGSVIDLSSPDYKILTRLMSDAYPPRSNIKVGLEGDFGGTRYRVVGRLRYVDAKGWQWDEWFMVAADGSIRYLEEDEDELVLLEPITPTEPPPISELQSATTLTIDGRPHFVEERSTAKIAYFEGQLPWKVTVDTEVSFADLTNSDGGVLSVEWTKRELEFYAGTKLTATAVARAFRLPSLTGSGEIAFSHHGDATYASYDEDENNNTAAIQTIISVVVILFFLLFSVLADSDGCGGGGGYGGGGHYSSSGGFGK